MTEFLVSQPWLPTRQPKARVFHYTSAAGLLGILMDSELRATEAAALNDRSEIAKGWRIVHRWLESLPDVVETDDLRTSLEPSSYFRDATSPSGTFVLCASEEGDDANQWRLYGDNGRGYAIELDSTVPLAVVSDQERRPQTVPDGRVVSFHTLEDASTVSPWTKVLYRKRHARTALDELREWAAPRLAHAQEAPWSPEDPSLRQGAEAFAYSDVEMGLSTIASSYKVRGFSGENEARVFVTFTLGDRHALYRPSPAGVVRYLRLAVSDGAPAMFKGTEHGRLPIKSVRLGPAIDRKAGRLTVESLLRRAGYENVKVAASKVRLR
ncbi:DUF2971 domain-containing protein [Cellulomonas sp. JH27-2]|uniref:DUF2971 domain-containing protein n=1 Tax=Cellulomonas sp. JH27-2 TaxID=2774139 RepID=UPI00177BB491|nr:DUF2971 domain-containing protein [Cellulomonas sp. JH27-2]MBD8059037.1 DUF2971 domain-containing protein [Cellulomonas sp. JH27-2]